MCLNEAPFTEMLIEANRIDPEDFQTWIFCENMLFNAPGKWWGDHGRRDFPHEGIDLCLYADGAGKIGHLDERTRIPVMHNGVVRAVFKDYLGQAVIIEHKSEEGRNGKFLSAYAHTTPQEGIQPGVEVKRGDIIAAIADTHKSKANIIPHLHFSLGRPSPQLAYESFVWNIMRDSDLVELLDPLEILDWPSKVLDARNHPDCRYS